MRFLLVTFVALSSRIVQAADCSSGDAPSSYSGYQCDGGTATNFCTYTVGGSTDSIACDISEGGFTDGQFYAATHYGSSTREYSFWGLTDAGHHFCCTYDETHEVVTITVTGTTRADLLMLSSADGSENLEDPGGTGSFSVSLYGGNGADELHTSRTDDSAENVFGESGDDEIFLWKAAQCTAGAGADTVTGSSEIDVVVAEASTTGGSSDDIVAGYGDIDEVYGGGGNDIICGDNGNDLLYGGTGNDTIWGGLNSAVIDGGTGYDYCNPTGTCEDFVLLRPGACP